jgi:2-oxoglutarate dehydrogenase E2 component (dihydrolipoamide succinyltransferase)
MPTSVVLPKIGRLMTDAQIQSYLKKGGEQVKLGEPIALIETEKVTAEITAPASGIFQPIATEGSRLSVGEVVALILGKDEKPPERMPQSTSSGHGNSKDMPSAPSQEERMRTRATPAARKLARELNLNLEDMKGSGPGGSILVEDVSAFSKEARGRKFQTQEDSEGYEVLLSGWRKVMAQRMDESARTVARVTTVAEVDATHLVSLREQLRRSYEIYQNLTFTPIFIKTVAGALREFPMVNASLVGENVFVHSNVNVGVAISSKEVGLVVPVIRDADKKNIATIAQELDELGRRADQKALELDDVSGGTFTLTNSGMMGVILDTPIVLSPQVAILGVGAIVKRPVVREDKIEIRSMMYLSLSYDHRILEGAYAIGFLQKVKMILESPSQVLNEEPDRRDA